AAHAAEEARKKVPKMKASNVHGDPPRPLPVKSNAMRIAIAAEPRYVPAIIGLRPTVSKSRPSRSGPRKFPTAKTMRKTGTKLEETPQKVEYSVPRLKVTPL